MDTCSKDQWWKMYKTSCIETDVSIHLRNLIDVSSLTTSRFDFLTSLLEISLFHISVCLALTYLSIYRLYFILFKKRLIEKVYCYKSLCFPDSLGILSELLSWWFSRSVLIIAPQIYVLSLMC